ncbi:hypothetical protein TYRP_015099 [Tyrophagus putrescentiae]|nr:hypothetical protein TYRP_015099 [Tyrophagus putrescentiae]
MSVKRPKYLIVQSLVPGRILRAAVQKTERPQAVVDRNHNNIAQRGNHPTVVDHREDVLKIRNRANKVTDHLGQLRCQPNLIVPIAVTTRKPVKSGPIPHFRRLHSPCNVVQSYTEVKRYNVVIFSVKN